MDIDLPSGIGDPYFVNINDTTTLSEGNKRFYLKNHLDNVLVTINDRKTPVDTNSDSMADFFEPVTLFAEDTYPFGLQINSRTFSLNGEDSRHTFNGKELDQSGEWGSFDIQDYGARPYCSLIPRFWRTDDLERKYPWYTPYQFAGNTPIQARDIGGLEPLVEDGILVGYNVMKGQGPTHIALDVNDPKTQAEYGYTLQKTVEWHDIIYANLPKFQNVMDGKGQIFDKNNLDYWSGNINPNDKLDLLLNNLMLKPLFY